MPANVPGFLWRRAPDLEPGVDPDYQLQLFAVDGEGVAVELPHETIERNFLLQIRPLAELTPGTQLAFSYVQPRCGSLPQERVTISINVTDAMPIPERLGRLRATSATGMIRVASEAGDCDRNILAGFADIRVELDEGVLPYADVLRYELRVDGEQSWKFYEVSYATAVERRLGASSLGPGRDRLYTPCTLQPRLSAGPELGRGRHRVVMLGILPDDTVLESNEIDVDLRCDLPQTQAGSQAPPRNEEQPPLRAASEGCTLIAAHGGASPGPGAWLALLGALMAIACARTRRRISAARRG